jgi:hypothetical protein
MIELSTDYVIFVLVTRTPCLLIPCNYTTEPVDVVLFEGWMFGFNPLAHIPLPVYTNDTAEASVESDGTVSADSTAVPVPEPTPEQLAEQVRELAAFNEEFAKARNIKVSTL